MKSFTQMVTMAATIGVLAAQSAGAETIHFELTRVSEFATSDIHPHQLRNGHGEILGRGPDDVEEIKSTVSELKRTGYRYQAPMYFGTGKNKGRISFDTGSSYTVVTSDICAKCHTKVYQPGTSDLEENLGTQWQIEIE